MLVQTLAVMGATAVQSAISGQRPTQIAIFPSFD